MMKIPIACWILAILFLLTGCSAHQAYKPNNSLEQAIFVRANSQYTPHDVRRSPDEHIQTIVAWVGSVENVQFNLGSGPSAARILLKHRKADFMQYSPAEDEFRFSDDSPSGYFQLAWPISGYQEYEKLRTLQPGDLLIAYGYPTEIVNGIVGIHPLVYVRPIGELDS
jgi:hypothetical protein